MGHTDAQACPALVAVRARGRVARERTRKRLPKTRFGAHLLSLRRARGLTQDVLAARSGLSPDTIRRLEFDDFSPSLDTLQKLSDGLQLRLGSLFESYDLGERDESRELLDLVRGRSPEEIRLAFRVMVALFEDDP